MNCSKVKAKKISSMTIVKCLLLREKSWFGFTVDSLAEIMKGLENEDEKTKW